MVFHYKNEMQKRGDYCWLLDAQKATFYRRQYIITVSSSKVSRLKKLKLSPETFTAGKYHHLSSHHLPFNVTQSGKNQMIFS
jgi:hypothetical protein